MLYGRLHLQQLSNVKEIAHACCLLQIELNRWFMRSSFHKLHVQFILHIMDDTKYTGSNKGHDTWRQRLALAAAASWRGVVVLLLLVCGWKNVLAQGKFRENLYVRLEMAAVGALQLRWA